MTKAGKCRACGTPWDTHPEIGPTCAALVSACERLESARSTLRIISTWATFQGGVELVPEHVARLIGDTLERIG